MTKKKDYREHQPFDRSPYNKPPTTPFDPDKPVQTRDGRKARIICTDAKGGQRIIALVERRNRDEYASWHALNGRWWSDERESKDDLINIPEKRWAVIFDDETWMECESEADIFCAKTGNHGGKPVACIEFTEGEGL